MSMKQTDLVLSQELRQLVQRAEQGDLAVLPALRKLLDETPAPSDEQILRAVSGNLCRCGAYLNILRAGRIAATQEKKRDADRSRR